MDDTDVWPSVAARCGTIATRTRARTGRRRWILRDAGAGSCVPRPTGSSRSSPWSSSHAAGSRGVSSGSMGPCYVSDDKGGFIYRIDSSG